MSVRAAILNTADAALVGAFRRDDPNAAEQLLERYGDDIYRLAMRATGSSDDAEAVTRDTLWAVACDIEGLLQRNRLIEREPQADRRIKAMRLTPKGSGALAVARPLWARAQRQVLGELGPQAWRDTQRRLTRVLGVAVEKRRQGRERRRGRMVRSAPAVRPRGARGGSAGRTPSPRPPRKRRA